MTTTRLPRTDDHRALALEHTSDDLFDMAARSAQHRAALIECLAMLADRERRLRVSREAYARLRDENRMLRASIMQADMGRAA